MSPDRRKTSLELDHLDERLVPSTLSLTTKGAEQVVGGAIVRQTDAQPTGTGHIHSFVRFQGAANGSSGSEQGYNTTARPLQFDENKSPQFTRELTADKVPQVALESGVYREFLLDVNQKSSSSKLSLDKLQLFLADRPDLTGYKASDPALGGAPSLGGHAAVFDVDGAGDDVSVLLDARLNSGSGAGDMLLYVPDAAFAGAGAGTYVYVYTQMGATAGATANGGFEEWAVRSVGAEAGGNASISGRVFYDVNGNAAESGGLMDAGDTPLANVVLNLRGTDDLGNTVDLTAKTAADGTYTFGGLRPGTYSVFEAQPSDFVIDGDAYAGTLGGIGDANSIVDITLAANEAGYNYNFVERQG